ncbi:FecR domain-containing protein [Bacteroides sp. OttesenSCG-928-D19]|nr:FecR domain-containing protein [Bacteroides sp. OttesenSCG-928-D19]
MKNTNHNPEQIIDLLAASTRSPKGKYSADESYKMLEERLAGKRKRLRLRTIQFISAAAAILICVLGWSVYTYMEPVEMQTVSTLAEVRTIQLPDGSEVALNNFTTITYPRKFKNKYREVRISGEAYFEVTSDKNHPFIVQTGTVNVEVLGTHFNVEAYDRDSEVKTTLFEGSVAVSNKEETVKTILVPNERAIYNKVEGSLTKETATDAWTNISWKEGKIIFINQPLKEIARQLTNTFNTPILIENETLKDYKMTGRFVDGESLNEILQLLQTAGNFEITKSKERILIK